VSNITASPSVTYQVFPVGLRTFSSEKGALAYVEFSLAISDLYAARMYKRDGLGGTELWEVEVLEFVK
jgi:hypothetical protein